MKGFINGFSSLSLDFMAGVGVGLLIAGLTTLHMGYRGELAALSWVDIGATFALPGIALYVAMTVLQVRRRRKAQAEEVGG